MQLKKYILWTQCNIRSSFNDKSGKIVILDKILMLLYINPEYSAYSKQILLLHNSSKDRISFTDVPLCDVLYSNVFIHIIILYGLKVEGIKM